MVCENDLEDVKNVIIYLFNNEDRESKQETIKRYNIKCDKKLKSII